MNITQSVKKAVTGEASVHNLHDLFVEGLKDIYYAENQLMKALKNMSEAASSAKLAKAFTHHRMETEGHISRLEQVFTQLDMEPEGKKCDAIEGLIAEGDDIIAETMEGTATRDAGLIFAAQAVEHYEKARYEALKSMASKLALTSCARLLGETLREEDHAAKLLTTMADDMDDDALTEDGTQEGSHTRGRQSRSSHASR
ncbi:MAG: DUF892 family protein [Proteobacteria bacterium]|nr:DUF892 family protein [Pseudomonadota bacterium]